MNRGTGRDPRFHTWLGRPFRPRSWFSPFVAAIVVVAATGPIHAVPFRWYVPVAVAAAGLTLMACTLWRVGGEKYHGAMQLFMLASAFFVSAWLFYASFPGVWHSLIWWTLGTAAGATVIATPVWAACRHAQIEYEYDRWLRRQPPVQMLPPAPPVELPPPPRNEWELMFEELGRPEVRFVGRRMDRNGNLQIRMRIMSAKVTFDTIRPLAGNIEVALSHRRSEPLPPGSITLERFRAPDGRETSTDFVIHVNTINILAKLLLMPEDHAPRSVKEAFTLGHFQDGRPFHLTVREIHWIIIAISGNGKSNLLHAIIYRLGQCYDAVIWMIDMKGGATAKPWLRAWLDRAINPTTGKPTRRPVLDWVAVDRFEAERIYRAFIAIASARPFWRSGSRTVPTKKRPHIILITDEQSRVTGSHTGPAYSDDSVGLSSVDFANLETDAAAIARSEACSLIKASQRNTVTTAGKGDATANYKGRICLGAADVQDARMVHPKSAALAQLVAGLKTVGTMLAACDSPDDRELPIKVFFMGDDDDLDALTYEASVYRGDIVPGLHECGPKCTKPCEFTGELEIANEYGYADRWQDDERYGWVLGQHRGPWVGKPLRKANAPAGAGDGTAAGRPGSATALLAEMQGGAPATTPGAGFFPVTPALPAAAAATPAPGVDPELAAISAALGPDFIAKFTAELGALGPDADAGAQAAANDAAEVSNVDRVEQIIDSHGTRGCSWSTLVREMIDAGFLTEKNKSQASRWLLALKAQGRVRQVPETRGPYFTLRNLQRAA